ncbi:MAG TPA: hypothetical protein VHB73_00685, partial [Alphaproteobacteria bacterium]|nr:hypothetical protein [Alphaproteobacteria bacterium]
MTALLTPGALLAQTSGACGPYRPTVIEVAPVFQDVDYEFRQPMMKIKEVAEQASNGAQTESWPVGLSVGQLYFRLNTDIYKSRTPNDPAVCAQVKAVHVEMGFVNNVLYVAREFPKRSCPFKVVLEHEEKHKSVDRQLLDDYAVKAKDVFARAAADIGMLRNPSGEAIERLINAGLNSAMESFSAEMNDERKKRQKEVDTSEEYA